MSKITTLACDAPHAHGCELAAETVRFGLNGTLSEMDLCAAAKGELAEVFAEYAAYARPARHRAPVRSSADRRHSAEVRAWAVSRNIPVLPTGRLPGGVIRQYEACH